MKIFVQRPLVLFAAGLAASSGPSLRAGAPSGVTAQANAPAATGDADLRAGMAAVAAGEYAEAVSALSRALRTLGADPKRQPELVQAYLHLGVAFAGLGQESPARSQFNQALLRQPDAKLTVKGAPELARRLFEEAQREAAPVIEAAADSKKKASKTPLILAGVAAVGAGVGVATVAGGQEKTEPAPVKPPDPGPMFRFASTTGNPFLNFVSGEPASGTTLQVGTARPQFRFRAQISTIGTPVGPFAQLQATVDLMTLDRGSCWRAESAPFALAAGQVVEVVVDAFPTTPSCGAPFTTLTVDARIFDRVAGRQLSNAVYTGGYKVVP